MLYEKLNTFVERFFDDVNKMESYNKIICKTVEKIKVDHSEIYNDFEKEIDAILNSIYYEMVEVVNDHLVNKDGTKGGHWSFEDVKDVKDRYEIDVDCLEFWYAMNKEYSIHARDNKPLEYYIDLAMDIIETEPIAEKIKCKYDEIQNRIEGGNA